MKRFIILFIVFSTFGYFSSLTLKTIHKDQDRKIASTVSKDCDKLIKIFLVKKKPPYKNNVAAALTYPVTSFVKSFSKMTYKMRMSFLRFKSLFSLNRVKRSERFAYLANNAFEDNLIEEYDLKALAKRYEKSKRVNLYYDENLEKLVVDQGDIALSSDDTLAFFRRFKITDTTKKFLFKAHGVTQDEAKILENPRLGFNENNLQDALTYLHVCRSYSKKVQKQCLGSIHEALLNSESNPFIRKFIKIKKKNKKFYDKEVARQILPFRKEDPSYKAENFNDKIKEEIAYKTYINKSLRLTCESGLKSSARRNARGKLLQMILIGEAVSSTALYYFNERHDDIDKEWVHKLGENLSYHFVSGYIHSVITASAAGYPAKVAAVWLEEAFKDSFAATTYSTHLNPDEELVKVEVEKFLNNPDFKRDLEGLLRLVKSEEITSKINDEISRYLTTDTEDLSLEEREKSIDNLTDVLTYLSYKEISQGAIETGDIGLDYYAFNRGWDVLYSAESMALTMGAYHMMCITDSKVLKNSLVIGGATIYIFNKVGMTQLYQQLRVMGLGF